MEALLIWHATNDTSKLELKPDSGRDSQGNNVPYIGEDGGIHRLGGVRHFSGGPTNPGTDWIHFWDWLELFIPNHGEACTSVGAGTVVCRLY